MLNNNMNLNYVEGMTVDTMINIKINKIFIEAYKFNLIIQMKKMK